MLFATFCLAALLDLHASGPVPHVLGGEPALRRLADTGYARSSTFRRLIDELRSRRGFVVLTWSPSLPGPLRGALMDRVRVTPDGVTCLWVGLRPTRTDDRLLPLLAHELQHAVEALESGVVNGGSLEAVFNRIAAYRHVRGVETAAALRVQSDVRRELQAARTRK